MIGNRLAEIVGEVLTSVAAEDLDTTTSRTSQLPGVEFRKRRSGTGRGTEPMRIDEGITIVPLKPVRGVGTNERDSVGYRYMIAIAYGTLTDTLEDTDGGDWPLSTWEEAIRRRLHNKRMGSMTLNSACEHRTSVEPGELPEWMRLADGIDSTFLVVTEFIREGRRDG